MEDELFGWEEHEAFMAGSEDMELYSMRREAEEEARREWEMTQEEARESGESKEWLDLVGDVASHLENGLPPWLDTPAQVADRLGAPEDDIPF